MKRANVGADGLDYDEYFRRQTGLIRRAKRLPEERLENLAAEALRRLVAKEIEANNPALKPSGDRLELFCEALISKDETAAADIISGLKDVHTAPEFVYVHYLAAAARILGEWWEEDRTTFWQVTIGVARLLAIVRSMSRLFEKQSDRSAKSAVFAAVPGEQHVLGLHMAADMFRKDGWEVLCFYGMDHDQLVSRIEKTRVDAIGLSISGAHSIDALSRLVVALHVCCPNTPIVLSGHNIESLASKLKWMELDGVTSDIHVAKTKLNSLFNKP